MSRGELLIRILWGVLMSYSGIAIFVPRIRLNWVENFFWETESFKMGTVSSIGFAAFFWWPMLAQVLTPKWPTVINFLIGILLYAGFLFVGYMMDKYPLNR